MDDEPPAPVAQPTPGAVWPGRPPSGSFLFFDRKARGVGDLVTVEVIENISAEGQATTDLEKSSTLSALVSSQVGFAQLITSPLRLLFQLFGVRDARNVGAPGTQVNVLTSEVDDTFEGEGTTRRTGRFNAVITCRVLEELPGKLFHIRGRRALVVNHEIQYVTVEGYVRQQDIRIDNSVRSDVLAEARITLDGLGVIDDKQRPGWLSRVFSWVYPL
jgi:flagellar L-ring protein FlgH